MPGGKGIVANRRVLAMVAAPAALLIACSTKCCDGVPPRHFNDWAQLVSAAQQAQFDEKLARFEAETGDYILVGVYPSLQGERLEDFALRTANAWAASRPGNQNGVALFLFVAERRSRIEVGRGVTSLLSEEFCAHVLEDVMKPKMHAGEYVAAIDAGLDALIQALRNRRAG